MKIVITDKIDRIVTFIDLPVITGLDLTEFWRNPVLLWKYQDPIGKVLSVHAGTLQVQFVPPKVSPFANTIWDLLLQDTQNYFAIGFIGQDKKITAFSLMTTEDAEENLP